MNATTSQRRIARGEHSGGAGAISPVLAGDEFPPAIPRRQPIDRLTRSQIALAAQFLRSIRPDDGEVEIMLHEVARRLEQVLDTGVGARTGPTTAIALVAMTRPQG